MRASAVVKRQSATTPRAWYQDNLQRALAAVAERNPAFAQQLQRVAEQTNVAQTGGVHGTATVQGDNYGQSPGVNTGNMTQTIGEWLPKKKKDN
jgi:hypothetical protein